MRVFLSHSSSDKLSYVNYISEHLNSDDVIIDEFNFVRGMPSKEEMIRNIEQCDIFVFFISEESLMSNYVKFEIDKFEECGGLQKKLFVPIIIQENIKYHDERIRDWMRDYNLKKVSQPSKALALITVLLRKRRPFLSDEMSTLIDLKDAIMKGWLEKSLHIAFLDSKKLVGEHCFRTA